MTLVRSLRSHRTSTPASRSASLTCPIRSVPKWKTLAASTASAPARTAVIIFRSNPARGQELGVGEILLNSMDADGTRAGFDLRMIEAVRKVVDVPVIASGGAGELEHFAPAVAAGADAVLAASVFHFGHLRIGEVKDTLRRARVEVR